MLAKRELLQRVADLDGQLSTNLDLSEQQVDSALDAYVEILGLSSEEDLAEIFEALDDLMRRHGLEERAFQRARANSGGPQPIGGHG